MLTTALLSPCLRLSGAPPLTCLAVSGSQYFQLSRYFHTCQVFFFFLCLRQKILGIGGENRTPATPVLETEWQPTSHTHMFHRPGERLVQRVGTAPTLPEDAEFTARCITSLPSLDVSTLRDGHDWQCVVPRLHPDDELSLAPTWPSLALWESDPAQAVNSRTARPVR